MKKRSDSEQQDELFNQLIGLGASSKAKSYYPDLIKKLEELRLEKEKYQSIFLNANEGIFRATLDGSITDMNPAMNKMCCSSELGSCIPGKISIQSFLLDKFLWSKIIVELKKQGAVSQLETMLTQFGGHEKWISLNLRLSETSDKKMVVEGIVEDITERKKMVDELSNTKVYLNNIVDSMPSILIGIDSAGCITSLNKQAKIYGEQIHKNILGQNVSDMFPHCKELFDSSISTKSRHIARQKNSYNKDGVNQHVAITIYPLTVEGAEEAIIRMDDITEAEEREIQLQRAMKMQVTGLLAGGIAHDFNNLLTGSLGAVSILKTFQDAGRLTEDTLRKNLEIIENASKKSARMVQQLLTLSKKQDTSFSLCDLNKIIEQTLNLFRSSMDKTINIVTDLPDGQANVLADFAQIEQVLLNLLVNASHAMTIMHPPSAIWGGDLLVSIKYVDRLQNDPLVSSIQPFWKIEIRDSGVGISEKVLQDVFTPFFTTKEQDQGTGLGLAMAYTTINDHKGKIEIASEPGVGTSVSIYLPVCLVKPVPARPKKQFDKKLQGEGTILIIDDEKIVIDVAKEILSSCGYKIYSTTSGEEGISLYKQHFPSIKAVLLDMSMPVMSGKQVYEELVKFDPEVRVILASGNPNDARVNELLQEGRITFQPKPFTFEKLATTAHGVIVRK